VISLPTVIDVVSSLCLQVARMAPWCRPGEIGVRLDRLCHRTDHNGGSEILLVLTFVPIASTSAQVGVFIAGGGGPFLEVW
jgi:hypothetical protein